MKNFAIGAIHLVAIAHMLYILTKESQSTIEGLFFVTYVIAGAIFWKKIAKQKKKEFEKNGN